MDILRMRYCLRRGTVLVKLSVPFVFLVKLSANKEYQVFLHCKDYQKDFLHSTTTFPTIRKVRTISICAKHVQSQENNAIFIFSLAETLSTLSTSIGSSSKSTTHNTKPWYFRLYGLLGVERCCGLAASGPVGTISPLSRSSYSKKWGIWGEVNNGRCTRFKMARKQSSMLTLNGIDEIDFYVVASLTLRK